MDAKKNYEKRLPHYKWIDWHGHGNQSKSATDKLSDDAVDLCRESSERRTSFSNATSARKEITNMHISERIQEVQHWFLKLERSQEDLEYQIKRLTEVKEATEKKIKESNLYLEAIKDILSLRDRRREIDVVEDGLYEKTNNEFYLLSAIVKRLQFDSDENTGLLTEMVEHRNKVIDDLRDKRHALQVDHHLLNMTPFSADTIGLKPWPDEKPNLSVDLGVWLSNCVELKRNADALVEQALQKTAASRNLIADAINDIEKCREVTRTAMDCRLEETLEARDNLNSQRKQLIDRVSNVDAEIKSLETAMGYNRNSVKLVHTRLEDRKFRLRKELCINDSDRKLLEENAELKKFHDDYAKTLGDLKTLMNALHNQLQNVENDLQRKESSLAIEMTCVNIHNRPPKAPFQSDITWLYPSNNSSYVKGFIERHINEREFSPMYQNYEDGSDYISRRLLELSLSVPPLNRQVKTECPPSKIVCNHW